MVKSSTLNLFGGILLTLGFFGTWNVRGGVLPEQIVARWLGLSFIIISLILFYVANNKHKKEIKANEK